MIYSLFFDQQNYPPLIYLFKKYNTSTTNKKNMNRRILVYSFFILLVITNNIFAQNKTITGKVSSADDGQPLPGVSVKVKGLSNATTTNANGEYSLSIPANATTLQFTYIGFAQQEVAIGARTNIDVVLREDTRQLSEVIVTANNIQREARSLGYAATTVKTQELTQARDRSVLNALQGKVAGVQISNGSGSPGSSTRVVIRGGTSLTGNNQALFVVDGLPIDNSSFGTGDNLNNQVDAGNRVNDINPDDIESMTILKGPTAAALYGSRASNGAIIITTKNGKGLKGDQSVITVNSAYSFENILRLPEFQNSFGQGGQGLPDSRENFSWGPAFDGRVRPWGQEVDGEQRVKPYVALPDNVRNFFDIGQTLNNSVSLSQGGEKTTYYLSFGNIDQKGVMPGTGFARTSIKLSGTSQISKKVYTNGSINYVRSKGDLSVQGQSAASPYAQILGTPRDIPITELRDYENNKFNTLAGYYGAYTTNPYYLLGKDFYRSTVDRLYGSVQVGIKATDWLDVSYRIGTDVSADGRSQATSKRTVLDANNQNFANNYLGRYEEANFNVREINSDFIAAFKKDINANFKFNGTLGFNNRQRNLTQQISSAESLVVAEVYNLSNVDGKPIASNLRQLRRLNGVYADANFSFKNYLFLGISGRNDWSSTLPKGNNSFFYPSVNTSFVFTDALKLSESKIINFGKIRLGYAQVGNDAGEYLLRSVFTSGTISDGFNNSQVDFPINGVAGFEVGNRIGNPTLKPEITGSFEAGLDLGLFKDRIGVEATYYSNNSRDQIINVPVSPGSGFTSKTINAGSLTNKGIELLLRLRPIQTKDFRWDLTTTFTRNRSLVKELFAGVDQIALGGLGSLSLVAQLDQPYGVFFGTDYLRDPEGRVVIDENTGYPLSNPDARVLGNIQPNYLLGLNTSFNYKAFTLTGVLDVKNGGTLYSKTVGDQQFVGTDPKTLLNNREPFVFPNSVIQNADGTYTPNTDITVANAQDYWTNFTVGADNLLDASYVKLREVTLSYQFPSSLLKKTPIKGLQFSLTGRNLILWTPKSNTYIDPEVSSFGNGNVQGYEFASIPSLRTMGANLRITF